MASTRTTPNKRGIALAAAFLIGLLGASIYLGVRHKTVPQSAGTSSDQKFRPGTSDPIEIFDPKNPLVPDGTETTLSDAQAKTSAPIYRPEDADLPNPEVWMDPSGDRVAALRYGDYLVVTYTPWDTTRTPEDVYRSQAADWNGTYDELNGHPAWIDPPNPDATNPFSAVHMYIDGTEVELWGRMPIDDLVSLAETVKG